MVKEVFWQGMTEEEVKGLSSDDFVSRIPARQRRSMKRGHTEAEKKLLKKVEAGESNIKTHCRTLVLTPALLGKTIAVYTGKKFEDVTVTLEMLGHCIGEFALTRKAAVHPTGSSSKKGGTVRK